MSEQENICRECGGVLHFDWIMTFEQCAPHAMRVEPKGVFKQRVCPGHFVSGEWEQLDSDQKDALDGLRKDITNTIISFVEIFKRRRPELKLTWNFTLDAYIHEAQDTPKD